MPKRKLVPGDTCRGFQHLWDFTEPGPGEFRRPEFGTRVYQICVRCDSFRYRLVSRDTGNFIDTHWSYRYSNDFPRKEGLERKDYRKKVLRARAIAPSVEF